MNIVYFYVLGFLEIATADDCADPPNDCWVEQWTDWSRIRDCGENNEKRTKVCSTYNFPGWSCNKNDKRTHHGFRTSSPLAPCRKF